MNAEPVLPLRRVLGEYVLEPPESKTADQGIRLAPEVLHRGVGVCMDWTLLLAGGVRAIGIYSLVVVCRPPDRHAS